MENNIMRNIFVLSVIAVLTSCGAGESSDDPDANTNEVVPGEPVNPEEMTDDTQTVAAIDLCEGSTATVRFREDMTLSNHAVGVDYVVTCSMQFLDGRLTIESGTEVVFGSAASLRITDDSEIRALGGYDGAIRTSPSIVFRGDSESGQPSWNGLSIGSASVDNYLENVEIRDAGFQPISSIFFPSGPSSLLLNNRLTIKGLTIENSGGHGLYLGGEAVFGQLQDVVIGETARHPLLLPTFIAATQLTENKGNIVFTSSSTDNFQSVGLENLYLDAGLLGGRSNYVFEDHGIPYFSYSGIAVNGEAAISINSGVDFIVAAGKKFRSGVGSGARIAIAGTSAEPVTFRGAEPIAGFWDGLEYRTRTSLNKIDHVVIEDAVNGIYLANQFTQVVSVTVNDSLINNTSACGIGMVQNAGTNLVTSGNTYTNNGQGDMSDPLCLGNFVE